MGPKIDARRKRGKKVFAEGRVSFLFLHERREFRKKTCVTKTHSAVRKEEYF